MTPLSGTEAPIGFLCGSFALAFPTGGGEGGDVRSTHSVSTSVEAELLSVAKPQLGTCWLIGFNLSFIV